MKVSAVERDIKALDYRLVYQTNPRQAAVRFKTLAGWTGRIRLRDSEGARLLLPESKTPYDMGPEFANRCNMAIFHLVQKSIDEDAFRMPCKKFKTCRDAMEAFEAECKRDHHGNAFKNYFNDKPLTDVDKNGVRSFVTWLMEKYGKNEFTVCKKVFAASSLFKWLKENSYWLGGNPFSGALSGVKYAPRNQQRNTIETEEWARIQEMLRGPRYRNLRILCEILACTGLRPTEALNVTKGNVDCDRLTITYLRTKRKNKSPDWRKIPVPARLVAFLLNENIQTERLVPLSAKRAEDLMREVADATEAGGLSLKTFRKDFATRARLKGASVDDLNLFQGRQETILEKHYTTDPWFIVHQCRPWIDRMFGENTAIRLVK